MIINWPDLAQSVGPRLAGLAGLGWYLVHKLDSVNLARMIRLEC